MIKVSEMTKCQYIVTDWDRKWDRNLSQKSLKVIHFGGNRKPVYGFIVTFPLSLTILEIHVPVLPVLYAWSQFFHIAILFRLKLEVFLLE